MNSQTIAALLIGQSPRPDLVQPLRDLLPNQTIIEVGALDGLTVSDLPDVSNAPYPLGTRMQNGRFVFVTAPFIEPLLQAKLNEIEQEISATMLLCAGTFDNLQSKRPFIRHPLSQRWRSIAGQI